MIYLLDTDICSCAMKRTNAELIERIQGFAAGELKVSAITVYELEYGARSHRKLTRVIKAFLENVEVLPLSIAAAQEAGIVRAELEAEGSMIGAYDLLIAGHARSLKATLITNNFPEFSRVRKLRVETWP